MEGVLWPDGKIFEAIKGVCLNPCFNGRGSLAS